MASPTTIDSRLNTYTFCDFVKEICDTIVTTLFIAPYYQLRGMTSSFKRRYDIQKVEKDNNQRKVEKVFFFLHGVGGNGGTGIPVMEKVSSIEKTAAYAIDYKDLNDGICHLKEAAKKAETLYGRDVKIILCGHSLGGILAMKYALTETVEKVIAISSRLRILEDAPWKCFWQDISDDVKAIEHGNQSKVDLGVIAGSDDRLVPREAMLVSDKAIVIKNRGHLSTLYDLRCHKQIIEWIT